MYYNQKGDINQTNVKKIIQTIYYTTGYPVAYYDVQGNLQSLYGSLTYPSPLEATIHFSDVQLQSFLTQNQLFNKVYVHQNKLHEYYIVYGFYNKARYQGLLVMGPMMTTTANDPFITQLISRYNQPLQMVEPLRDYFTHLPKVKTIQFQYFEALLEQLTKYPLSLRGLSHEDPSLHSSFVPLEVPAKTHNHHPYQLEKELHTALFKEDGREALLTSLNAFQNFPKPSLCEGNLLRSSKNHFICSCTNICRAAIEAGLDSETAFSVSDQLINQVEGLETLQEVNDVMSTLISTYQYLVKKHLSSALTTPIRQVKDYVQQHLTEPLTLNELSHRMGYSSKYISDLFYKEVGSKYKYYVNEKKIALAKSLLLNVDNTISDVSHYLSYCNPSYFGKVFKVHTGLSPKDYITRHQR